MLRFKLIFSIFFILIFSASSFAAVLLDRVVAVVNKEVITWSELYRNMEIDASPKLKELSEEERRKIFKENEAIFLEKFINIKLQLQEARRMGIGATDKELKEAIENIKRKYTMTDSDFIESLEKEGYTFAEYSKRLLEQIILKKIINYMVRSKTVISEDEIKGYIEKNKEMFEKADLYRIYQIFFRKTEDDNDRSNIEEKAALVLNKLKDGEIFENLAKEYSEDPSAGSGGDLGFLKEDDLNKEFREILSKLEPGEVSSPFWTDRGLHIIKFGEKIEHKDQDNIREEVREKLRDEIFMERYNKWIKGLREKSFIEIRL